MGSQSFGELMEQVSYWGHWSLTDEQSREYIACRRACEAGLRRINRLGRWQWLHTTGELEVVTGTYRYPQPAGLDRMLTESFFILRNETEIIELAWGRDLTTLNAEYHRTWRFSDDRRARPQHVIASGREFWLAPVPDDDSSGTLHFEYYSGESSNPDTLLRLPDQYFDAAVHAALAEGLKNQDDTEQDRYEQLFMEVDVKDLLSDNVYLGANDQMAGSYIADATRRSFPYTLDGYDY